MLCPAIDNPDSCEIRTVIPFLHAKNTCAEETHRELCAVYSQIVISEGTVKQWCGGLKMGKQMFRMKSEAVSHL
jgi:hypothetical protein